MLNVVCVVSGVDFFVSLVDKVGCWGVRPRACAEGVWVRKAKGEAVSSAASDEFVGSCF